MAIVRWDPSRELDSLQSEFNRLFDTFLGNGGRNELRPRRWVPAMDLVEDVDIEVKDNVLTVSGERKAEHEDKTDGYYRIERAFGSFSRSLTLPQGIDSGAIDADFTDGVLEVRIPKPEERKPHRVSIGAGSVSGTATEK